MKRYYVYLPVSGLFCVELDAESKEDAIDRALNGEGWPDDPVPEEWDVHRRITQGNVCHASHNEAWADEA